MKNLSRQGQWQSIGDLIQDLGAIFILVSPDHMYGSLTTGVPLLHEGGIYRFFFGGGMGGFGQMITVSKLGSTANDYNLP